MANYKFTNKAVEDLAKRNLASLSSLRSVVIPL
jgi:hypothetical protein